MKVHIDFRSMQQLIIHALEKVQLLLEMNVKPVELYKQILGELAPRTKDSENSFREFFPKELFRHLL